MKIDETTTYKCDLCGARFSLRYSRQPNHIAFTEYDPLASTRCNTKSEYDLCESCACEIQRIINKRKDN